MKIEMPHKLEGYFRSAIIKQLKILNPQFDYANTASWQIVKPTLEEPVSREVIELELKNVDFAWQRCLKLTKTGASRVHLVLHPKLYETAKKLKSSYIIDNPIAHLELYSLPKREKKECKTATKKKVKPIIIAKTIKKTKPAESLEDDLPEDTDLEAYWATKKPELFEQVNVSLQKGITCSSCKELIREENCSYPVCQKYNWEIAPDLAERDAVCEE